MGVLFLSLVALTGLELPGLAYGSAESAFGRDSQPQDLLGCSSFRQHTFCSIHIAILGLMICIAFETCTSADCEHICNVDPMT
jgi:hypothetical protein